MSKTNDPSAQMRHEQLTRFIMQERREAQLWIMMERCERRFVINMDDLRTNEADLADYFLSDPITALPRLEEVLTQIVLEKDADYFKLTVAEQPQLYKKESNKEVVSALDKIIFDYGN